MLMMKKYMRESTFKLAGAWLLAAGLTVTLPACSSWVYRIDVPQGNFLEQKDINKLRIQMTKEQVQYVLGNPVAENSFENDTWHYFYLLKSGKGEDQNYRKNLVLTFANGRLAKMAGDFEVPKNFNTPLDQ